MDGAKAPSILRVAMSHAHKNRGTACLSLLKVGYAPVLVHTANAAAVRVRRTRNCRHGSLLHIRQANAAAVRVRRTRNCRHGSLLRRMP